MEYEFSRDPIRGGFHAKFAMEHELFAVWLVDEIGDNKVRIGQLQTCIEQAKTAGDDVFFAGREYQLSLNQHEVCLALNSSLDDAVSWQAVEALQAHDVAVDDDHYRNLCGFDDFILMWRCWCEFVA